MIDIVVTKEFEKRYKKLPNNIQRKAEKQEKIFRVNPFRPSLKTEKLIPKGRQLWSMRIDRSYRIIFRFLGSNKVIFLTVGDHNWIYNIGIQ